MNKEESYTFIENFLEIELDELPKYSSWLARLVGLSNWTTRTRSDNLILKEYGLKWGELLHDFQRNNFSNLDDALKFLFKKHFPSHLLFHVGEQIYYSETNDTFWNFFYMNITEILTEYLTPNDTIVELGCGWGRNLFIALQKNLCKKAIGGDFTDDGLVLGKLIGERFKLPIEFFLFDYYNPDPDFMHRLKETVVFTHNSIEQISSMPEETILALIESKPKAVIHFEPIFEYRNKDTIKHYLWKRYTEVNDYNRNLLTVLQAFQKRGRLKITTEKIHALGLNAFNPGSFIVWEPV